MTDYETDPALWHTCRTLIIIISFVLCHLIDGRLKTTQVVSLDTSARASHIPTRIAIKTTLDNTTTVQYAGLISSLSDKARSVVRDLDPSNDLTFLRIRSKKDEIMVAPDKEFLLIVVQTPSD
ncbi:hypothetical protein NQ318_005051 [Aromia moschata]|uniref:Roadblock/LAMTOR2 domain-containing protein n=1 Tax=Aromia moschata TaxID=1265417 RepID=A0AAV8YEX5_9CUCU|nr:hypothetical protein NQ318_005051 [Aromia moschata]